MTELQTREQAPRLPARPTRAAAPPSRAGAASGFSLKDAWRIIQRHLLLEAIILALVVGLTVGATALWMQKWPIYVARSLVKVSLPRETFLGNTPMANDAVMERHVMTQIALIKSDRVLRAALEEDDALRETSWFQQFDPVSDPLMNAPRRVLTEEIIAQRLPDSDLIGISMNMATSDQQKVTELATIVNAVARAYVRASTETTVTDVQENIRMLNQEVTSLTNQLDDIEEQRTSLIRNMPVPVMTTRMSQLEQEMRDLTDHLAELRRDRLDLESQLNTLRQQRAAGAAENIPEVVAALENDFTLRQLLNQQVQLIQAKQNLLSRFGLDHPEVRQIDVQLQSVEEAIAERRQEILDTQLPMLEAMLESQLVALQEQIQQAERQRNQLTGPLRDIEQAMGAIDELDERKEELNRRIARLQAKLDDLSLLPNSRNLSPAQLWVAAEPPDERNHPQWKIMLPVGVLMGLVLSVGVAFLLEFADSSVKTPTDISRRLDLPLLSMIPHESDMEEDIESFEKAVLEAPRSLVAENFRELRTNLLFSGPASQRRSLLISSPSPEDGRTTVAVNLAAAMANSGRKVLLVDANFRRPGVRALFSASREIGLSDVLTGQAQWRDAAAETEVENLTVLSSGSQVPPNPAELLGSDLAKTTLSEMQAEYDQVIFDGPPLLLVSDGAVLASLVDGVVMVVRAGENSSGIVSRCRQTLSRVGAHVLGVVLNGVRATAGGYLRKNYDTFYDYHELE